MLKKYLTIIIITFIVLVLAAIVLMYIKNKSAEPSKISQTSDFNAVPENTTLSGRIYFVSYESGGLDINYFDATNKETKKIYSDKNDNFKLVNFGGFSYLSSELFVYQKNGDNGQLVSFKLGNEIQKKVLKENFLEPISVAADPLGKNIYYSFTDLTDKSPNNLLYTENRDGKNRRLIYESNLLIENIQISSDGGKVIFASGENKIMMLDLETIKATEIFQSTGTIFAPTLMQNDDLIFTESRNGINNGTVSSLNIVNRELKKVLVFSKDMPNSVVMSPDLLATAVIKKNFKDKYDKSLTGDLNLVKIGSDKLDKVGSAIKIICWQP